MRKLFAIALLLLIPFSAQALEVPNAPTDYVLDQANIFSDTFEYELSQTILDLETNTTGQIGVLTIPSLDGAVLESYAVDVFREWGIGQEEDNNGVLLLIALEEREVRIEVGYGLEGRITDADASKIIRNIIVPAFAEENYEEGVRDALSEIVLEIEAEAEEYGFASMFTDGVEEREGLALYLSEMIGAVFIAFFIFVLLVVVYGLMSKEGRKKSQKRPIPHLVMLFVLLTSETFGIFGWIAGLLAAHGVFAIIKKMKFIETKGGGKGGRKGPWIGGFGGGSSGGVSGGTSFGGFGGGSTGGGGASGKW